MEPFSHDISHLFKQLGMQSSQEFIEEFIATHHLSASEQLSDASFLHPAQKKIYQRSSRTRCRLVRSDRPVRCIT